MGPIGTPAKASAESAARTLHLRPYPKPCRPPLWARTGHGQTILSHFIPTRAPDLKAGTAGVEVHDIPLPCGDKLRAFYAAGSTGILVAVFHGLSGDTSADYVRKTARLVRAAGHSVLAVNHRGCGAGRGLARGVYHSGRSDDVGAVFSWARGALPETRHVGVGVSLSGNALLLLLTQQGPGQPDAAIAINPPANLEHCSKRISSGINRLYDWRFVRACTELLHERRADGLLPDDFEIPRVSTLWEFDEEVTAPLGGFASALDYYQRCSTYELFDRIERPTVIITSQDDPFVPVADFESARSVPAIHLHVERFGGHVGYLERGPLPFTGRKWIDGAVAHYLSELCAVVR